MVLGVDGEKKRDFDFLASIEVISGCDVSSSLGGRWLKFSVIILA